MNPILKAVKQIAYSQERSDYEDYESKKIKVFQTICHILQSSKLFLVFVLRKEQRE